MKIALVTFAILSALAALGYAREQSACGGASDFAACRMALQVSDATGRPFAYEVER